MALFLQPRNCSPVTKIAFAKTHKTASSTLQNILLRYGYKNGHKIALPQEQWFFSMDSQFTANMVANFSWSKKMEFDIFASHSLWNANEIDNIIPRPSVKFTLLRDPVEAFESGFVYMGFWKTTIPGKNITINEFAELILQHRFPGRPPEGKKNLIPIKQLHLYAKYTRNIKQSFKVRACVRSHTCVRNLGCEEVRSLFEIVRAKCVRAGFFGLVAPAQVRPHF